MIELSLMSKIAREKQHRLNYKQEIKRETHNDHPNYTKKTKKNNNNKGEVLIEQRSRDQQSAYNVLQAHDFMILRSKRQWKGSNFINLSSKQRRNSSSVSPTTKTLAFYGGLSWLLIFRGSLFTPLIFLIPPLGYQIVTVGFK